jgi:type IV pilus assembly protein PilW
MSAQVTSTCARERGFTLIELMVAITIGLVLTIVVAQLFLGSRRTYATTDDVSRMQESIRYTYQLLTRTVHLAGYKSSPNSKTEDIFAGANVVLEAAEGTAAGDPDGFTVRFQGSSNGTALTPDNTIVNCLGVSQAAGDMAVNLFTIAPGANTRNALFCNGTEIVPNVQNMQVFYGVDTNSDLVADIYVPQSNGAFNAALVRSLRIAMLFETPNLGASPLIDTNTYELLAPAIVGGTVVGPFNDTRIRRVVTMTISMRNRTP